MSTLTITGIQSALHWENRKANLGMFEQKIFSISQPTEIVVLPEMFSTGFSMQPEKLAETMHGETLQWMRQVAAQKKIILTGSVIIAENENYYNRLVWVLPNGQVGYYDKRHLFAYGDEDQHYSPGEKRLIASVNGWKINLLVCYDLRFPVWSRQSPPAAAEIGPEYDVLIYVANWPEKRVQAWTTLLRARAIENQCYVIGVNRTGDDGKKIHYTGESMAIDPMGEILYHKKDEEDIFTVTLDKSHLQRARQKFPFWKDADGFKIITNN
jgi:predicted amidohydrolase